MNNKLFVAFGGLVVGLVVGFFLFSGSTKLGAITPSSKTLDSQDLTTELSLIAAPLQAIEQYTTANITVGSVGTTTPTTFTVTSTIAAAQGDLVFVQPVTTSTAGLVFNGGVATASTTGATFEVSVQLASGTAALTQNTSTYSITVLPRATFIAPTGL